MRKAESAGIRDLESWLLVRLAMKASWLSLPSCNSRPSITLTLTHRQQVVQQISLCPTSTITLCGTLALYGTFVSLLS